MAKESYIDSEIFRNFKNLQENKFQNNGLSLLDIKFHYPIESGEADIYLLLKYKDLTF